MRQAGRSRSADLEVLGCPPEDLVRTPLSRNTFLFAPLPLQLEANNVSTQGIVGKLVNFPAVAESHSLVVEGK